MLDNGEHREDLAPEPVLEGGWLDAELRDTFPASDPLPHWPGPPRPLDDADRTRRRMADRAPGREATAPTEAGGPPSGR